jgi:hypothetical protein
MPVHVVSSFESADSECTVDEDFASRGGIVGSRRSRRRSKGAAHPL